MNCENPEEKLGRIGLAARVFDLRRSFQRQQIVGTRLERLAESAQSLSGAVKPVQTHAAQREQPAIAWLGAQKRIRLLESLVVLLRAQQLRDLRN